MVAGILVDRARQEHRPLAPPTPGELLDRHRGQQAGEADRADAPGRCQENCSGQCAKNSSTSGRFASMIPMLRASTASPARSAISDRISLGALLQIVV